MSAQAEADHSGTDLGEGAFVSSPLRVLVVPKTKNWHSQDRSLPDSSNLSLCCLTLDDSLWCYVLPGYAKLTA